MAIRERRGLTDTHHAGGAQCPAFVFGHNPAESRRAAQDSEQAAGRVYPFTV